MSGVDLKALKAKLVEHFKTISVDLKKNKVCQLSEKLIKEGESAFSLTVPKAGGKAGTAAIGGSRFASIEAALAYVDKIPDLSAEEKKAVIDATRHGWELSKEIIKQCKAHLKSGGAAAVEPDAAAKAAYDEAQKAFVVPDAPVKKVAEKAAKRKSEDNAGDTVAKEVKVDAADKPKKARKPKAAVVEGEASPSKVQSPKKPRKPKAPSADISAAEIEQVIAGVVPNALQH